MTKDKISRSCELCETKTDNPVMGWGNEKPIAEPHWFCSTECRTEFAIAEKANELGIDYTMREYHRTENSKIPNVDEMSIEDMERLKNGEILDLTDNDRIVMSVFLDPFDEIKIW